MLHPSPRHAVILIALAASFTAGCDDSTSKPPPSATGQGINNLAESPSSLLGKSAARGRDVAKDATNYQSEVAGIAGQNTGETQPVKVSGVALSVPTAWTKRTPSGTMIKPVAEFLVAPDDGNGDAVVKVFSNIGGGVESNINRWKEQVLNPDGAPVEETNTKKRTIAGIKVTTVSMEGTLKGGVMGGPSQNLPNSSFRAAIIEGPDGTAFIKFTGPASVVKQNDAAWDAMINGMHKP